MSAVVFGAEETIVGALNVQFAGETQVSEIEKFEN
jgi:hypothetical protein